MKRLTAILLAAGVAAFAAGCSNKTVGSAPEHRQETAADSNAASADDIEADTYAPLASSRDRNIVSAENYDYEIYEGGAIITKYKGRDTTVVLPEEIEGCPVTNIGFYAFEAKFDIVSVSIPESVTVISEGAFMDCSSLSDINLPSGLKEIGRGAFAGCASLTEMTVPDGVKRIEEEAFTACEGMTALHILSPELKYENWGLEELPDLTVYAPEGSAAAEWAAAINKN